MNSILVTNEINEDYVAYLKNMPSSYLESLAFDYGVDLSLVSILILRLIIKQEVRQLLLLRIYMHRY